MSKESRERGEKKREAIRIIIFKIMVECVEQNMPPDKATKTINRHIDLIKSKTKPQELSLLTDVIAEIRSDTEGFCNRMHQRERERHESLLHQGQQSSAT